MNQAIKKSSSGDDDCVGRNAASIAEQNAGNSVVGRSSLVVGRWSVVSRQSLVVGKFAAVVRIRDRRATIDHRLQNYICYFRLLDLQIRLRLEHLAHLQAIG